MSLFKFIFNHRVYLTVVLYSFASAGEKPAEFPLKDFVPVDFFRQYFSISPRLDLSGSNRRFEADSSGNTDGNSNGDGGINLHHEYRKYSQAREFSGTSEIVANGSYSTSNDEPKFIANPWPSNSWYANSQRYSNLSFSAFSDHMGKWYLTEKVSLGVHLEPLVNVSQNKRRTRRVQASVFNPGTISDSLYLDRTLDYSPSENRFFDLQGSVWAGYGKIYDVAFAAKILFLLDRIRDRTGKDLELDVSEMKQLEGFVESRRKERPFYDSRLTEIFDVESIEMFLRKNGSIDYFPSGAILEMADEWQYTQWQERLSGWEVKLFPYFELQFRDGGYSNKSETQSGRFAKDQFDTKAEFLALTEGPLTDQSDSKLIQDEFRGTKIFGLGATMAYHIPYRRFYQASASLTSRFEKNIVESGQTTTETRNPTPITNLGSYNVHKYVQYEFPGAELGMDLSLAFFPSSRTSIFLNENTNYRVKFDYSGNKESLTYLMGRVPYQDSRVIVSKLELKVDYFLGFRLKLWISGGVYHSNWNSQDVDPESSRWLSSDRYGTEEGESSSYRISSGITYYLF